VRAYNFFACGSKFTKVLTSNVREVVVDHLLFHIFVVLIYSGVNFALKVDNYQKSRRILDVFCPPKSYWGTS